MTVFEWLEFLCTAFGIYVMSQASLSGSLVLLTVSRSASEIQSVVWSKPAPTVVVCVYIYTYIFVDV